MDNFNPYSDRKNQRKKNMYNKKTHQGHKNHKKKEKTIKKVNVVLNKKVNKSVVVDHKLECF